ENHAIRARRRVAVHVDGRLAELMQVRRTRRQRIRRRRVSGEVVIVYLDVIDRRTVGEGLVSGSEDSRETLVSRRVGWMLVDLIPPGRRCQVALEYERSR